MTTRKRIALAAAFAALAGGAAAQPGPPAPGGSGPGARRYDPKTVETVSGKIARIERLPSGGGTGGVHLVLETDAGATYAVHLGPAWYVDRQDTKLAAGDRIQVRGSRLTMDGRPVILAATVTKGERTLVLRDDTGVPKWSGGGRGPRRGRGRP
jgi:hypothetical protein